MNALKLGVVSCGFLGCAPVAPGTFGTLGGVLIAWALSGSERYAVWISLIVIAIYFVGRSLGEWAETYAKGKDPGFFVLDEVVGYLIATLWVSGPSLLALTVAFIAFRFFDIVKPPPAKRLEGMGGGDGIMLDDVMAGVYAFAPVMLPARPLFTNAVWNVTTG